MAKLSVQRTVKFREKNISYSLRSSSPGVYIDSVGTPTPSSITVSAYQQVGGNTAVKMGSGYMRAYAKGMSGVSCLVQSTTGTLSLTSAMLANSGYYPITVRLFADASYEDELCQPLAISLTKEGEQGVPGDPGEKGDDGVVYTIDPSASVVNFATSSSINPSSLQLTAYKREGTQGQVAFSGWWTVWNRSGGVVRRSTSAVSTFTLLSYYLLNAAYPLTVTVHEKSNSSSALSSARASALATATIAKSADGVKGDEGDEGPAMLHCGVWSSTKTYFYNETGCCYVLVKKGTDANGHPLYNAYRLRQKGATSTGQDPVTNSGDDGVWKILSGYDELYVHRLLVDAVAAHDGTFDYLHARHARFWEVQIEGVLNNLVQVIDDTNWNEHFSGSWLDPLSTGAVIDLSAYENQQVTIELPCAFYCTAHGDGNGVVVRGMRVGGENITLSELRQCVGKRFYFLPSPDANQKISLRAGVNTNYGMIVTRSETYTDIKNLVSGSTTAGTNVVKMMRGYQYWTSDPTHFVIAECKMGVYDGSECIYWEVQGSASILLPVE